MATNRRPQHVAQLDQEWTKAREWCGTTKGEILMRFAELLSADDPKPLIEWMTSDPNAADIVQRLALLALHQSMFNTFEKVADDI